MSATVGPNLAPGESPFPHRWERDEAVLACPHNEWETVLVQPRPKHIEECVRCVQCHAPRCGHTRDEDPCLMVRHHVTHHTYESGRIEPVGGYQCHNAPGCSCGATTDGRAR